MNTVEQYYHDHVIVALDNCEQMADTLEYLRVMAELQADISKRISAAALQLQDIQSTLPHSAVSITTPQGATS
jgi:hypothetical protein